MDLEIICKKIFDFVKSEETDDFESIEDEIIEDELSEAE